MPQHPEGIVSTAWFSGNERTLIESANDPTAFCWQWPCNCIDRLLVLNWSLVILPRSISRAMNSSIKNALLARTFAASRFSSDARSGYSSLKVSIAEGSMPISGVASLIKGLNKAMFWLAMIFAFRTNPLESQVLPLSPCTGIKTS